MIVNWKRDCSKGIPDLGTGRSVILAPGYTEIPDADWKRVRMHILDLLEKGIIEEEWTKTKFNEAKSKPLVLLSNGELIVDGTDYPPSAEVSIPSTVRDIHARRLTKIIENTLHTPTLKAWLDVETRDEVRILIKEQMSYIKNPRSRDKE